MGGQLPKNQNDQKVIQEEVLVQFENFDRIMYSLYDRLDRRPLSARR